jgi:hypothetical protein
MSPVSVQERSVVTEAEARPLRSRDRAVACSRRVWRAVTTHRAVRGLGSGMQHLPPTLVRSYNELRKHWRQAVTRHSPLIERVEPAFATPGQALTSAEAAQIERYLKEPEGVTVTVSTWHEDQLVKPVSRAAWADRPVVD